jgi:IS1 family transposase
MLDERHYRSYIQGMNKLLLAKRVQILSMLCEGSSMRSISRVADVSINTVYKLLAEAGPVCAKFHNTTVRGVASKRVQCDEAWAFCYAKQKNVATAKAAPDGAGDVWTWTALDADSKLILSWQVGGCDASYALALMDDLRSRITTRVQLTTDGHRAYLEAVEEAFGADIDYGMLVKLYGAETGGQGHERKYSPSECLGARKDTISGNPDPTHISTSYTERHNLTMRMSMRRFTSAPTKFERFG